MLQTACIIALQPANCSHRLNQSPLISGRIQTKPAMDFLDQSNFCGQTLLRLCSRGSAIIAELLRLGGNIPAIFRGVEFVQDPDELKYIPVLFDFQYLKTPEDLEKRVNDSTELLEIDDEFMENHMEIMERFYTLFESIHTYIKDYNKFLKDLTTGFFIQVLLHSLELRRLPTVVFMCN